MEFISHEYQRYAIDYVKMHLVAALFLDMGLGLGLRRLNMKKVQHHSVARSVSEGQKKYADKIGKLTVDFDTEE